MRKGGGYLFLLGAVISSLQLPCFCFGSIEPMVTTLPQVSNKVGDSGDYTYNEMVTKYIDPKAQIFASTRVLLLCDMNEDTCQEATKILHSGGATVLREVNLDR
jgi:hypothetical protein